MTDHSGVKLSRSQRAADATTEFSGSWKFVIGLSVTTMAWVWWNRGDRAFDPYPWLMWNSILTVVSTFQSPLIMMSQNRQIERDKQAADRQAALDRELVQGLHDKLDSLTSALSQESQLRTAAPDLLEACQFASEWFGATGEGPVTRRLRAAIAKAEGRS